MISSTAAWPRGPVRLTWVPQPHRYREPVTAVHCFCFSGDQVVLVDVRERGLSLPGGHLRPGEHLLDSLRRELAEEACVTVESPVLLGAMEVDHSVNPVFDPCCGYPMNASQLLFSGPLSRITPFEATHETSGRLWVPISECPTRHHEWNDVLDAALHAAVSSRATGEAGWPWLAPGSGSRNRDCAGAAVAWRLTGGRDR